MRYLFRIEAENAVGWFPVIENGLGYEVRSGAPATRGIRVGVGEVGEGF